MYPNTTRTIGPLHLEDLEPRRFEDLVRQLIYDFRQWYRLEATGRAGSDDGFDVRGIELTKNDGSNSSEDADEETDTIDTVPERVWLIQCKREKAIGPTKLKKYLEDIPENERKNIHGLIFAAACDFSKQSRDIFYTTCRSLGFLECHLWGKAELEDMLFQPKNDYLLFAYLGVSLQIQKRSLKTKIRSFISIRRKIRSKINPNTDVLILDAADTRYPYLDENEKLPRKMRGRWRVWTLKEVSHDGIIIDVNKYLAYAYDDKIHWDSNEKIKQRHTWSHEDPWDGKDTARLDDEKENILNEWRKLPDSQKAWHHIEGKIPYESILDIDEIGDDFFKGPIIYTSEWHREKGPFIGFAETVRNLENAYIRADKDKVRKYF